MEFLENRFFGGEFLVGSFSDSVRGNKTYEGGREVGLVEGEVEFDFIGWFVRVISREVA